MPLPDADKKSPRVYTLLQNLDLENLSADNLADVGDPIAIEEANEDELRRLCLVAFARMVTKGSFDGWLTAGGNEFNAEVMPQDTYYVAYPYDIARAAPYGTTDRATGTVGIQDICFWPWIAPNSGALASIAVKVTSGAGDGTTRIGIFSDNGGVPQTLMGYADLDTTGTGVITQTSLSETITTVRGTQYWYAHTHSTTNYPTVTTAATEAPGPGPGDLGTDNVQTVRQYLVTTMATVTDITDLIFSAVTKPIVGLKW